MLNTAWKKLRNPTCTQCELHRYTKHPCLIGRGPTPCDIMIVGEAPGEREDDIGKPFAGKAGRLLDETLEELGISREQVFISNVIHCRPPENRTPTKEEIKACLPYLHSEMRLVQPKFILLLGNTALYGLLERSGITKYRGEAVKKDGIVYLPTFHPAAVLRQPHCLTAFKADVTKFFRMARRKETRKESLSWQLVKTSGDLREMMKDLVQAEMVSFDVETQGLNPFATPEPRIYCLGMATPNCSWVIPFDYPKAPPFSRVGERILETIAKVLQGKAVVGHNAKFDNKWLMARFNVRFPVTFDTMLAAYLLDENSPHGLKYLAEVYFNAPDYAIPVPVGPREVSLEKLGKYCAYDVHYTLRLYPLLKEELSKDRRVERVFYKLLMPASELFERAELNGVYVDKPKLDETEKALSSEISQRESELSSLAGRKINWNSPAQVAAVLFNDLRLPVIALTKSGKPSTSSEQALPYLKGAHPVVERLLEYREKVKLYQFIQSWKEKISPRTGRMHPNFKLHGTVTGRLSCEEPNLQQVPRDSEVRSLITAPPGWVLVEADYSQIELRIAAALSRDSAMLRAFQTGEDIHVKTAVTITGLPPEGITKEMRKRAKAVNFGFVYGMGAGKFKEYAKVKYDVDLTDEEAEEFRAKFFELYCGLPDWHRRQRNFVDRRHYVRTPIGRKRRIPEILSTDRGLRKEAERQAINSPVQSAASDINLFAAVRIAQTYSPDEVRIIGTVHDAILMEVREDILSRVVPEIRKLMEDREIIGSTFGWDVPVPLEVEIKAGPWGSGTVIDAGK